MSEKGKKTHLLCRLIGHARMVREADVDGEPYYAFECTRCERFVGESIWRRHIRRNQARRKDAVNKASQG